MKQRTFKLRRIFCGLNAVACALLFVGHALESDAFAHTGGRQVRHSNEQTAASFVRVLTERSTAENFEREWREYKAWKIIEPPQDRSGAIWDLLSHSNRQVYIDRLAASPKTADRLLAYELSQRFFQSFISEVHDGFGSSREFFIAHARKIDHERSYIEEYKETLYRLPDSGHFSRKAALTPVNFQRLAGKDAPESRVEALKMGVLIVSPMIAPSGAMASLPALMRAVGTFPIYQEAAARLALLVQEKVNDAREGRRVHGSLFEDTVSSFIQSGDTLSEAIEHSFRLLGFYGSRGVAFIMFFDRPWKASSIVKPYNLPLFTAVGTIAAALPYLDAVTRSNGHPYSLPIEITSSADYTRPYHFWYAAELAREIAAKGFSPEDALEAVQRLGFAYEMFADVATNHPKHLKSDPNYHYNIETKADVFFNGLGAAWGLKMLNPEAKRTVIDADRQLAEILKAWDKPEYKSFDEIVDLKVSKWAKIFLLPLARKGLAWANRVHPLTHLPEWKNYLDVDLPRAPELQVNESSRLVCAKSLLKTGQLK
ncbi:MAG: hypothetical protein AB1540_05475 [Bdellovibrionota bacterium]